MQALIIFKCILIVTVLIVLMHIFWLLSAGMSEPLHSELTSSSSYNIYNKPVWICLLDADRITRTLATDHRYFLVFQLTHPYICGFLYVALDRNVC